MVSHADELIGHAADLLFQYQTKTEVIGLREVLAGSHSQTVVERVAPIPRKVSLLVADALLALRAALEHTLFAEVEFLDGTALDEKAARLVEMPTSDTYETFQEWLKGRARKGPSSLRTGTELVRRIDGLQPYHRYKEPHLHPLARLVLHTNHAKHRTPALTAVRLAAMYRDDERPNSVSELPPQPEEPLRVGDVIAETPLGNKVPVTLFPTIGINRPGTEQWPVLMKELDEIFTWVRTQAVPRLITGDAQPEEPLPTRYEIAVGHEDERRAIAEGSTLSAADRHNQRLLAATARLGLGETIGMMDGSPSSQQIAAWLEDLSDGEVLDRMSQVRATFIHGPSVIPRNLVVLEGLRDEALAFAGDPVDGTSGEMVP